MKKLIFIAIFLPFLVFNQNSLVDSYTFEPYNRHYTALDGLASNETYTCVIDNRGFLWIATDKGVSRFNGYEFENFTTNDGLVDNTIFNIYLDKQDRIWFGGNNGKLCYWDWSLEAFVEYEYNEVLISNNLRSPFLDISVSDKDEVFVGSAYNGYLIIDSHGRLFEQDSSLLVRKDTLARMLGIKTWNKEELTYLNTDNILDISEIITVYGVVNGRKFKLLADSYKNLYESDFFKYNNWYTQEGFFHVNNYKLQMSQHDEFSVVLDKSMENQYRLDCSCDTYLTKTLDGTYSNEGIQLNKISAKDVNQCYTNGKALILLTNNGVYVYSYPLSKILNLKQNTINAFSMNSGEDGQIIVSNNDYKQYFSVKSNVLSQFRVDNKMYPNLKTLPKHDFYGTSNFSFQGVHLRGRSFLEKDNHIYVCNGFSVRRYETKNLRKKSLIFIGQSVNYCITNLGERIILGTNNGLKEIMDTTIVDCYIAENNFEEFRIQSLETVNETLLIATRGSGLFLSSNDSIIKIDETDGLPSNIINCLYVDENDIWVGTNKGAVCIKVNGLESEIQNTLNTSNGLISNDIRQIITDDNKLYFGCDIGISVVTLSDDTVAYLPIPVEIDRVLLNDSMELEVDSFYSLTHYQNNLQFDFTGISPLNNEGIQYRYKLDGISAKWTYTEYRNVRYSFLPFGIYNFQIQARNSKGEWPKHITSYKFEIRKPFWQTWWFILLTVALLVLIIMITIRQRMKSLQMKMNEELRVKTEINILELKALKAQMNPHFIFNSLTAIQNFVLKGDKHNANNYLTSFSHLIRLFLEVSSDKSITLQKEIELLTYYVNLEQLRFSNKFTFHLEVEEGINESFTFIPSMLIQPFIENAINHGLAMKKKPGDLWLSFELDNAVLKCTVKDNGIGRDASKKLRRLSNKRYKSRGLDITKQRMKLMDGKEFLNYDFEIEDLTDVNGNSLGTIVHINIILQKS